MFAQFPKAALLPILATTLSACGGGSTSPVPFTSMSELPADGAVELQGQAHTAAYTTNSADGTTTFSEPSESQDSSITVTYEDGRPTGISASAGDSKFRFGSHKLEAVEVYQDTINFYIEAEDDSDYGYDYHRDPGSAKFANSGSMNLDHMTFGTWYDIDRESPIASAGHYGAATPKAAVPSSGTASYRGKGFGIANHDGIHNETNFDVAVTTSDFSAISVQSSNTTWREGGVKKLNDGTRQIVHDASALDFSGTGQIDGSGFNANLTSSAAGTGTATGSFYGPNAEEVGGSFAISGSGSTHIGAFGASR